MKREKTSRKNLTFIKEYENKIVLFVRPHFNICPDIEKYYYLSILLMCSVGATNVIQTNHSKIIIDHLWCKCSLVSL